MSEKKKIREQTHVCDRCECIFATTPGYYMTILSEHPHYYCPNCTVQMMEDAAVGKMVMMEDPKTYRILSDTAIKLSKKINNFMSQH